MMQPHRLILKSGGSVRRLCPRPLQGGSGSSSLLQRCGGRLQPVMSLKTGIVGLPNVGKSTLFNAMCENAKAEAANFPFCTIEPNVGLVSLKDPRLTKLAELSKSAKVIPATVEFVDIAGLVKGASQGEGLGNKFLSNIRECDALVQVARCFDSDDVIHVDGRVDPVEDIATINLELALSDIGQLERRLEKLPKLIKQAKGNEKGNFETEKELIESLMPQLETGKPVRACGLDDEQLKLLSGLQLLTSKPLIYAANVSEDELADPDSNVHVQALRVAAKAENAPVVVVSAQVESELIDLSDDERLEFLDGLGVSEGGLQSLVREAYGLLGLSTYFTTGETESRAWTIRKGMTAPQAAGVIHTDFEKGFIKAETIGYSDFLDVEGSWSTAKDKGVMRLEGKEYVVNEGDVMVFKFNN
ncbi:hypothetical protein PPROV_000101200 [Pycnococcus provasolii]|uniref:Obg-like ATPase 1 n=1 Tax=Pycnococcus provasolii TaxID=41880 RepID=A0A830H5B8_9CHLO|nr:hypothetical protein PPROV_000101200 [Pycnococcus provasolii]|mmetsp:Transcript_2884/g.7846  ORF Transcript_2884/g.7846 Transcript_2884/m.7846 type:complete len:416 (-) Transcript_2884:54-1301(-)